MHVNRARRFGAKKNRRCVNLATRARMREGKWELQVLVVVVDGHPLPEHLIKDGDDDKYCVESQPGDARFTVKATYHGCEMHQVLTLPPPPLSPQSFGYAPGWGAS